MKAKKQVAKKDKKKTSSPQPQKKTVKRLLPKARDNSAIIKRNAINLEKKKSTSAHHKNLGKTINKLPQNNDDNKSTATKANQDKLAGKSNETKTNKINKSASKNDVEHQDESPPKPVDSESRTEEQKSETNSSKHKSITTPIKNLKSLKSSAKTVHDVKKVVGVKKSCPKLSDKLKEKEKKIQKELKNLGVNISDKTINQIDTVYLLTKQSDECNPSICEMVKTKSRAAANQQKNHNVSNTDVKSGGSSSGGSSSSSSNIKNVGKNDKKKKEVKVNLDDFVNNDVREVKDKEKEEDEVEKVNEGQDKGLVKQTKIIKIGTKKCPVKSGILKKQTSKSVIKKENDKESVEIIQKLKSKTKEEVDEKQIAVAEVELNKKDILEHIKVEKIIESTHKDEAKEVVEASSSKSIPKTDEIDPTNDKEELVLKAKEKKVEGIESKQTKPVKEIPNPKIKARKEYVKKKIPKEDQSTGKEKVENVESKTGKKIEISVDNSPLPKPSPAEDEKNQQAVEEPKIDPTKSEFKKEVVKKPPKIQTNPSKAIKEKNNAKKPKSKGAITTEVVEDKKETEPKSELSEKVDDIRNEAEIPTESLKNEGTPSKPSHEIVKTKKPKVYAKKVKKATNKNGADEKESSEQTDESRTEDKVKKQKTKKNVEKKAQKIKKQPKKVVPTPISEDEKAKSLSEIDVKVEDKEKETTPDLKTSENKEKPSELDVEKTKLKDAKPKKVSVKKSTKTIKKEADNDATIAGTSDSKKIKEKKIKCSVKKPIEAVVKSNLPAPSIEENNINLVSVPTTSSEIIEPVPAETVVETSRVLFENKELILEHPEIKDLSSIKIDHKSSTDNEEDSMPLNALKLQATQNKLLNPVKEESKKDVDTLLQELDPNSSGSSRVKRKYVRKKPKLVNETDPPDKIKKKKISVLKEENAKKDIYDFDSESEFESKTKTDKPNFKRKPVDKSCPDKESLLDKNLDDDQDITIDKKPESSKRVYNKKAKTVLASKSKIKDTSGSDSEIEKDKKPIKLAKKTKKVVKKPTNVDEDDNTSSDESDNYSSEDSVRTRIVKKRLSVKSRHLKLYGFWSGPKRHRVASLNAIAKVHCLYENETRAALEASLIKPIPKDVKPPVVPSSEDEPIVEEEEEEKEEPSTRTLRCCPGLRGVGKHWEMDGSSLGSGNDVETGSDESYTGKEMEPKKKKTKKKAAPKKPKPPPVPKPPKQEKAVKSKGLKKELKALRSDNERNYESSSSGSDNSKNKSDNSKKRKRSNKDKDDFEFKDTVVRKRMASLNASAMLAASYQVERHLGRNTSSSDSDRYEKKAPAPKKVKEIKEVKDIKDIKEIKEIKEMIDIKEIKELKEVKHEIEEQVRPVSSSVVIVQDTDVTITGVYVNSTLGTNQEAYCKMQYRVQSSVTEERVVRPNVLEQPPKSYTPLSALSNMRPPNDPSLSSPPLFPQPPQCESPLGMGPRQFYPPPSSSGGGSSAFCAPQHHDNTGYYQPAGPLISSHLLSQPAPQQQSPVSSKTVPQPLDSDSLQLQQPPQSTSTADSTDSDVLITGGDLTPRPQTFRYGPQAPSIYSRPVHQMHCPTYSPNYYAPYGQHPQEMCYSPSYQAYYPKLYPPALYSRRYIPGGSYYQGPPPPSDLYEQPPPTSAPPPPSGAQIVPAGPQGPQHMEHYPGPPYYTGYSPGGGQCYTRNIQPPYMDTPYTSNCPCPMQSCPKNVNTGPLIGIKASKGPVTTSHIATQSHEPIMISSGSSTSSSSSSVESISTSTTPNNTKITCKTEIIPTILVKPEADTHHYHHHHHMNKSKDSTMNSAPIIINDLKEEQYEKVALAPLPTYSVNSIVLLEPEMSISPARGSIGLSLAPNQAEAAHPNVDSSITATKTPRIGKSMERERQMMMMMNGNPPLIHAVKQEIEVKQETICKKEDFEDVEKDHTLIINERLTNLVDDEDDDNQKIDDKSLLSSILPVDNNKTVQLDNTLPEIPSSTVKRRKLLANCKASAPKKSPPNSYKSLIKRTNHKHYLAEMAKSNRYRKLLTNRGNKRRRKPLKLMKISKNSKPIKKPTKKRIGQKKLEMSVDADDDQIVEIIDDNCSEKEDDTIVIQDDPIDTNRTNVSSVLTNIDLTIDMVAKGYFSEPELLSSTSKAQLKLMKQLKSQEGRSQSEQNRSKREKSVEATKSKGKSKFSKKEKSKSNNSEIPLNNNKSMDEKDIEMFETKVAKTTTKSKFKTKRKQKQKPKERKKEKQQSHKNKVSSNTTNINNNEINVDESELMVDGDAILKDAVVAQTITNNNNLSIENNNNLISSSDENAKAPAKRSRSRSKKFGARKKHKAPLAPEIEEFVVPRKSTSVPRWSNGWTWEGPSFQGKVFLNSDDPPVLRTCYTAMRHSEGDVIRPRDCVLLRAGTKRAELPFVAKVAHLWENPEDGEMMMSLLWYYRPEHTEQGRQPGDSSDEVFASRHKDHNSVACIEDKCYVLTFSEYCRFRRQLKGYEENIVELPSIVPSLNRERSLRVVPTNTSLELVLYCRRVYEFRLKRLMKTPN